MAFEVATIEETLKARAPLQGHRVQVAFEGCRRAGTQVAVEFRDPDGCWLEICRGPDQVGEDGKFRPPEEWREVFSPEEASDNPLCGQNATLADPALRND